MQRGVSILPNTGYKNEIAQIRLWSTYSGVVKTCMNTQDTLYCYTYIIIHVYFILLQAYCNIVNYMMDITKCPMYTFIRINDSQYMY